MLTLAAPVTIPNLNRLRVRRVDFEQDSGTAYVHVEAIGVGGSIYEPSPFVLEVRDGSSIGLRVTVSPGAFLDRLQRFTLATATGFTALVAAYVGANIGARNRAAETAGIAAGWLPGGVVS